MELRRLVAELLEGDEVVLRVAQGLRQDRRVARPQRREGGRRDRVRHRRRGGPVGRGGGRGGFGVRPVAADVGGGGRRVRRAGGGWWCHLGWGFAGGGIGAGRAGDGPAFAPQTLTVRPGRLGDGASASAPSSQRDRRTGCPSAARRARALARSATPPCRPREASTDRAACGEAVEDRADESGEFTVRADFEEGPHARSVHRLDLRDELDRLGELAGQQGAGGVGVVGVGRRGRVGEDRDLGRRHRLAAERLQQRPARVGDEAAVEGRRDRQPSGRDPSRSEQRLGPRDLRIRARQDGLPRRVLVGEDHVEPGVADGRRDLRDRRQDREHRPPRPLPVGHQPAAEPRQAAERRRVEPARRAQRRQLAVAVPGDRIGPHSEVAEQAEDPQADRPQSRLRHRGVAEGFLVPRPLIVGECRVRVDQVGKPSAVVQGLGVGLGQSVVDHREPAGERPEHPDVLRPLPREEHRQPPRRGTVPEDDGVVGGLVRGAVRRFEGAGPACFTRPTRERARSRSGPRSALSRSTTSRRR